MYAENPDLELISYSISPGSEPRALGGTPGVLLGYIGGTLGVLSGYSSPSVVYTSICLYVDTSAWMGARATPWHRALNRGKST